MTTQKNVRALVSTGYMQLFLPLLLAIIFISGTTGSGYEIENTQFFAMLKQGDVEQIKTVGNKKLVRVSIIPAGTCKIKLLFTEIFLEPIMMQ